MPGVRVASARGLRCDQCLMRAEHDHLDSRVALAIVRCVVANRVARARTRLCPRRGGEGQEQQYSEPRSGFHWRRFLDLPTPERVFSVSLLM